MKTAADGSTFVVLVTSGLSSTSDFDENGVPLFIVHPGENAKWSALFIDGAFKQREKKHRYEENLVEDHKFQR